MGSHSVLCALPSAMSRAQGPPDACLTLQDWAKAGPHEQPTGTALQRRKDRVELLRDPEPGPAGGGAPGPSGEEAPRPRMSPATIAAKVRVAAGTARLDPPSLPGQL